MNGRVAKQIRREIYGEYSIRLPRKTSLGAALRRDYRLAKKMHRNDPKRYQGNSKGEPNADNT